jgi:hypothetical protein
MRTIQLCVAAIVITMLLNPTAQAAAGNDDNERDRIFQERTYQGRPLTFWLKALRSRDKEHLSGAFDAIYSLGEDAWIAVPDLGAIVGARFEPIRIGRDPEETVASKVFDITVRTEAIETLRWIGPPAAPAAGALTQWALSPKVIPNDMRNAAGNELFVELVTMDSEQKMRAAGAIAQFGSNTFPLIAKLMSSSDPSRRRFAVAILSQDALPVAAELLRSETCNDRELGLQVLKDMSVVVESAYIDELARRIGETCAAWTVVR